MARQWSQACDFEFDPFDPAYFADPFSYYRVMRDQYPVYRREIPNHRVWPHYWMISRADDVDRVAVGLEDLLLRHAAPSSTPTSR